MEVPKIRIILGKFETNFVNLKLIQFYYILLGYIPNCALAIEAMLATASIGAIWSSTSPDFGVTVSIHVVWIQGGGLD